MAQLPAPVTEYIDARDECDRAELIEYALGGSGNPLVTSLLQGLGVPCLMVPFVARAADDGQIALERDRLYLRVRQVEGDLCAVFELPPQQAQGQWVPASQWVLSSVQAGTTEECGPQVFPRPQLPTPVSVDAEPRAGRTYLAFVGQPVRYHWTPITGADAYQWRYRSVELGAVGPTYDASGPEAFFIPPSPGTWAIEVRPVTGEEPGQWHSSQSAGVWIFATIPAPGPIQ